MILVVCPNPALDRIAVVRYRARATLRPERFLTWPGGSGVHAGHVATRLGADVTVIGFAGGATGTRLEEHVGRHRMSSHWFGVVGETRQTMSLIDVDAGNMCDVVEPGPRVEMSSVAALDASIGTHLRDAAVVVISGSLPEGCPVDLPARITGAANELGVPVIVDLEGVVLETAVDARPWMIKPSLEEISRGLGHEPNGVELLDRCERWLDRGVSHVCVSMADRGLLWLSGDGVRHISGPPAVAYNSIGCGDALVGATAAAYERHGDVRIALRAGVAAAVANLRYDEPGQCDPGEVSQLVEGLEDRPMARSDIDALLLRPSVARGLEP